MKQLKRLGDRKIITLGKEIRREGKGKVYQAIETPTLAAKIYPINKQTQARARKLELMLADPPENSFDPEIDISIAWPVDLLVAKNNSKEIVGYLMPKIAPAKSLDRYYKWRSPHHKSYKIEQAHRSAINLAAAFQAIHAKGYVIGDVNQTNILITETGSLVLVNTDSFQVCNLAQNLIYYSSASNTEFTPPELQRKNLTKIQRSPQQDLFGLGILIFKLLMRGIHPYDGVFLSTEAAASLDLDPPIRLGHFPYNKKRKLPLYPQPEAPPFNYLHPYLQELFITCFEKGHSHPLARPTAMMWQKALQSARLELSTCSNNPEHKYGNHLSNCPWCATYPENILLLSSSDRTLSPAIIKKNKKTYSDRKEITSPKITPQSSSYLPTPLTNEKFAQASAKSWLTWRRKLTIFGLVVATPLVLWLFIGITLTYPLKSILTIALIGGTLWIVFQSKLFSK